MAGKNPYILYPGLMVITGSKKNYRTFAGWKNRIL
jgi:hypothetical protein